MFGLKIGVPGEHAGWGDHAVPVLEALKRFKGSTFRVQGSVEAFVLF
jgi:hypothetical protein